jgi:hypothetical protein
VRLYRSQADYNFLSESRRVTSTGLKFEFLRVGDFRGYGALHSDVCTVVRGAHNNKLTYSSKVKIERKNSEYYFNRASLAESYILDGVRYGESNARVPRFRRDRVKELGSEYY